MELLIYLFIGLGRFVTAGSLLVHFGSWCDTVDGYVDQFSWFGVVDDGVDVVEDVEPDFVESRGVRWGMDWGYSFPFNYVLNRCSSLQHLCITPLISI